MEARQEATEVDIYPLVQTDIGGTIPPDSLACVLSSHPFISIPGSFNSRDINTGPYQHSPVSPHHIYRSGTLENLSSDGIEAIKRLNIRTIFDLRSFVETTHHPNPVIDGIEIVWIPSTWDNETAVQAQKAKEDAINQPFSFTKMYLELMQSHKSIFKAVLQHVRDRPEEPFMFHCTAGKDRTGVLAFLLLRLAGASDETITLDYALTRVGIEPVREFLLMKLSGGRPMEEVLNDETMRRYADPPFSVMVDLKQAVEKQYGGVESYVTDVLGLTKEDVERIKTSLRGKEAVNGVEE